MMPHAVGDIAAPHLIAVKTTANKLAKAQRTKTGCKLAREYVDEKP